VCNALLSHWFSVEASENVKVVSSRKKRNRLNQSTGGQGIADELHKPHHYEQCSNLFLCVMRFAFVDFVFHVPAEVLLRLFESSQRKLLPIGGCPIT